MSQVRQASIVAFYGRKPQPLADFLRSCQDRVARAMQQLGAGVRYRPSSLAETHATMIGLERRGHGGLENNNFHAFRGRSVVMRLPELIRFVLSCDHFPFHAQIGGFEDRDYCFQSRGARPYHRSFSVQGTLPVLIGWPVATEPCGRDPALRAVAPADPGNLEDLRRSAQMFNVLHRWHRRPEDVDNDLHIRLGFFDGELRHSEREVVEDRVRRALSTSPPVIVELAVSDLAVASYPADDETLPEARTKVFPLTDPRLQDEDFIAALYD